MNIRKLAELSKSEARLMLEAVSESWPSLVLFVLLAVIAFTMESR
jgi:hypothetical protein